MQSTSRFDLVLIVSSRVINVSHSVEFRFIIVLLTEVISD